MSSTPSSTWWRRAVSGAHFPIAIRTGTRCTATTSNGRSDGTWERIAERLAAAVRQKEGRAGTPSAGIVDARSVRATATVSKETKGFDAGKNQRPQDLRHRRHPRTPDGGSRRRREHSDNAGGITVAERARNRSARFAKLWCDSGFKRTFIEHCRGHHVGVEVVNRIHPRRFEVLPKRWIVERTWSWLMNSRRLQVDYERDPIVTEGSSGPPTAATSAPTHQADRVIALGK